MLTVSSRDVLLPRPKCFSVTVPPPPLSNFTIDALISDDAVPSRRRSPPVAARPPIASGLIPHDGVGCGTTEAGTPPPTPSALPPLTSSVGWASQINLAAMRRLLSPSCQLNTLAGNTSVSCIRLISQGSDSGGGSSSGGGLVVVVAASAVAHLRCFDWGVI